MAKRRSIGKRKVLTDLLLTDEEYLFIGACLMNPVCLAENVIADVKNKFHNQILADYQAQMCFLDADKFVNHSSPDTGKTTDICRVIIESGIYAPNEESLCTAPRQTHLAPIITKLESLIAQDDFIRSLVKDIGYDKSRQFRILWSNGHLWNFRIGSTGGEAFYGCHPTHMVIIDEAGIYPISAFKEIIGGRMKKGCKIRVYGMINGLRNSTLYRCAKVLRDFEKMNIPRWKNPNLGKEQFWDIINSCGGLNTQEARNKIFAIWGDVVENLFTFRQVQNALREDDEYTTIVINDDDPELRPIMKGHPNKVELDATFYEKLSQQVIDIIDLPQINVQQNQKIIVTIDAGYRPDPTVIAIFKPGNTKKLWNPECTERLEKHHLVMFIRLNGIHPDILPDILNYINEFYGGVIIGMDIKAYGEQVRAGLARRYKFPMQDFFAFDSGKKMIIDKKLDNDEESETYGQYIIEEEITKVFAVSYLTTRLFSDGMLTIPEEPALIGEMDCAWQKRNPDGRMVYNTTYDHHLMTIYIFAYIIYILEKGLYDEPPTEAFFSNDEPLVIKDLEREWEG